MPNLFVVARRGTYEEFVSVYDPSDATASDSTGSTVLHAALGNKPVVRARIAGRLLDDDADAAAVTPDGVTTAHVLLGRPRFDVPTDGPLLRRLFDGGCDPNRASARFGTPLLTLARQLKFPDGALAPLYDVVLSVSGLDPLSPPPPARSTLESVRLLGERRAALERRLTALLEERGRAARGDAPPIDAARARAVAEEALVELERDLRVPLAIWEDDPGVEPVGDHGDVWVVMWNSVEYLRSKDFLRQVLVGPVVVPKDGRPWFVLPTAYPVAVGLDRWRRGEL
ncbi:YrhB domain-containing protein [Cellulosimicrobium sp. Marseille-Q4280]|uniref:YrhB domain-containing protein n=1 Tax=Cellulosimicrobium sp. Marseille-Q4280 TaxID=2937992 RepID=UPI00203C5FFB|nr:YrhB domain-containing protein [Cellulosimicrobium sp. Marseille-Q4280]